MRKIVIFLICLMPLCLSAVQWGALRHYTEGAEREGKPIGERFLLRQVLEGKPIRVDLRYNDANKGPKYKEMISAAYAQWFSEPARLIRRAGREEEFADVLPLLERGIKVQFADEGEEADIRIYIEPLKQVRQTSAKNLGYFSLESFPEIHVPEDRVLLGLVTRGRYNLPSIILHEIGHSLGLSDQYQGAYNSDAIYSSQETRQSVMKSSNKLTCDDADGIINLIDITRGTSRGSMAGWRSLCKRSGLYNSYRDIYYVNGIPFRPHFSYVITPLSQGEKWQLNEYKDGRLRNQYVWSWAEEPLPVFDELEETVIQRDYGGRPERARGRGGEDIYYFYSYTYDEITKLTVSGGYVQRVDMERNKRTYNNILQKEEDLRYKTRYFAKGEKMAGLTVARPLQRPEGKEGYLVYQEGISRNGVDLSIILQFNDKGEEIERSITPADAPAKYFIDPVVLQKAGHGKVSAAGPEGAVTKSLEESLRREAFNAKVQELKDWYLRQ